LRSADAEATSRCADSNQTNRSSREHTPVDAYFDGKWAGHELDEDDSAGAARAICGAIGD